MRILAFTSIRSEYDLMSPLYSLLKNDPEIDFRLVVAGAHLSPKFDYSVNLIRQDGFPILIEIESLIDSDTESARLKSAANLLLGAIDPIRMFSPDLLLFAGDREEVLVGAMVGAYLSIPSIHFYGGDHAEDGHVDNPVRHATTKLATYHFVSHQTHADRILRMGEPEWRVKLIGSIALDKFKVDPPKSEDNKINRFKNLEGKKAIVIYHPIKEEIANSGQIVRDMIEALLERDYICLVGAPNTDPGNAQIKKEIDKLERENERVISYKNLSRSEFVSLFKSASLIIGNSSAGLLEAASVPIPAVNVGHRQKGRLCPENVIFVDASTESIRTGIKQTEAPEFASKIASMKNPFGDGGSAKRAYDLIKSLDFRFALPKPEDPLKI
ncbi:UDP-N-acetylglucosamine 2-epimerase (hydrolyzing) [Leptospira perolatii]|uniref:UDP-N-acetylglucosamine 2-epimerase (Hydrolyzing) n=1 Tax=Leptospira perolatii TaxID=2023191 RepID=A0A2M9ZLK1_9LEPT|nr:UDP-N-acetylglucosamine 2-epimerase [Leptospira perolatii]PJZ70293.1 UDP-N-acetylglucosamine 2-epimerase (hydrolyzing) [Leptospira perolatii]PJZ72823.1 UDP-N-acetylglucosamine 2-epimerase (hydrolyzing) [Leptospira perolatii]